MEPALIGLIEVLAGALLAEYFRRRNRVDAYAQKSFERRLEVYEGLMKRVQHAYTVANDVLDDAKLTPKQRLGAVSEAIHLIAEYTDDNALFIDSYVAAHATAMTMGVEDIPAIDDGKERNEAIARFRAMYKAAKQMILDESGIAQINRHLKIVSRSKPDSPAIRRIKKLEQMHRSGHTK
jgi:hypothetical protein